MSKDNVLDDLRAYVTALADDIDEAVPAPTATGSPRQDGRRRIAAAGVAAAIAVVVGAAVQLTGGASDDRLDTGGTTSTTSTPDDGEQTTPTTFGPVEGGPVVVLPEPPLEVRGNLAVAWAGDELIVWGGDVEASNSGLPGEDRVFVDGAAYDPSTNQWRSMSTGPLPAAPNRPVAAATDEGVVVARGNAVALWDPASDTWRELPDAPGPVDDLTWTGNELISASANALLRLGAQDWTRLDPPPLSLERPTTAWTGAELVVVGGPSTPFTRAAAIALDPNTRSWRELPEPPSSLTAEALAAGWDGDRIVVVNYDMDVVSYDPTLETWTELPSVPARFSEWYPSIHAADGYSVAFMAQAVAVLAPDGMWVPVPYGDVALGPSAFARDPSSGRPIVYTVGVNATTGRHVVTALDLAYVADSPPAIQVGIAAVSVPDGYVVTDTRFAAGSATDAEVVRVELRSGSETCVLTSGYRSEVEVFSDELSIEETLPETPRIAWRRNENATNWASAGGGDILTIGCDSPDVARTLARSSSV